MWSPLILSLLIVTSIFGEEFDEDFLSANKLLTASVYKESLKNGEENFLVSPFWAQTILALAQSGAGGETQEELREGLKLPNDQNKIETDFKSVLLKLGRGYLHPFHTANKLYLEEEFTIKDEFKKVATEVFDAGFENIKFLPDNVKAAETMNKWVEEQTESKIQNFTNPNNDDSPMGVLINALYFRGIWSNPFPKSAKHKFFQIDESVSEVDFMSRFAHYKYAESEELDAKFLEFPLQNDVSMVVVLPNEDITKLEEHIDEVFLEPNFSDEFVFISMPKFRTESKIDFKNILRNLGVGKPFAPEANFSGISDQNLLIADVIQKTYLDFKQDGVEAAAATYADISEDGAEAAAATNVYSPLHEDRYYLNVPKFFSVNHPFVYYIRHKNLIIFAGRIAFLS